MIENAIKTLLQSAGGITDLVGTRMYPVVAPQRAKYPLITYQIVSEIPVYQMEGAAGLSGVRLQLDYWAVPRRSPPGYDPYDIVRTMSEIARVTLSGFRGTVSTHNIQACFMLNARALHDNDTETFRISQDWDIAFGQV